MESLFKIKNIFYKMLAINRLFCYNILARDNLGASYNGSTPVSKTVDVGSNPTTPASNVIWRLW